MTYIRQIAYIFQKNICYISMDPDNLRKLTDDQKYDADIATRQAEINDWSYNNKMDTLFVFQILFVSILFACILVACKGAGLISSVYIWYSLGIVALIVILTIINRAMYTNYRRDSRYWNKRKFLDDNNRSSPLRADDPTLQEYNNVINPSGGGGGGGGGGGTGTLGSDGVCKCS
jgi:hypothetical protein